MHDGSLATLGDVIDFLASGGGHYANQSPLTFGFAISAQEKAELIAFLDALSDEDFVRDLEFAE
jgi:cytochrome c peroxidase